MDVVVIVKRLVSQTIRNHVEGAWDVPDVDVSIEVSQRLAHLEVLGREKRVLHSEAPEELVDY
jgi:hypothetical protein